MNTGRRNSVLSAQDLKVHILEVSLVALFCLICTLYGSLGIPCCLLKKKKDFIHLLHGHPCIALVRIGRMERGELSTSITSDREYNKNSGIIGKYFKALMKSCLSSVAFMYFRYMSINLLNYLSQLELDFLFLWFSVLLKN